MLLCTYACYVCVCVCVYMHVRVRDVGTHVVWHLWRSEVNFVGSVFTFRLYVGSEAQAQVSGFL